MFDNSENMCEILRFLHSERGFEEVGEEERGGRGGGGGGGEDGGVGPPAVENGVGSFCSLGVTMAANERTVINNT